MKAMKSIFLASVAIGMLTAVASLECPNSISDANYQEEVNEKHEPWALYLHATENDAIDDNYGIVASKLTSYGFCTASINCGLKENTKTCKYLTPRALPSLRLVVAERVMNPYKKKYYRQFLSMEAPFTDRTVDKFLKKALPEAAVRISTDDSFQQLKANITASTTPSVLFVTSNPSSVIVKVLSLQFGPFMNFYVVDSSFESHLQEYSVTSSPALAVVVDTHATSYDGDLKDVSTVSSFLRAYIPSNPASTPAANLKDKPHMTSDALLDIIASPVDATTSAWIVAVYNDEYEAHIGEWDKITSKAQGVVSTGVYKCSKDHPDLISICEHPMPYTLIVPYDNTLKKKMMTNLSKYINDASTSSDTIIKQALDTLPSDSVDMLSDAELEGFLSVCHARNLMPVISLSNKASPAPVLRNVALANHRIIKVAQIYQPSAQFLASIGNPSVPSISIMYPDRESENPQYKISVFDPKILGPLNYASVTNFIGNVYNIAGYNPTGLDDEEAAPLSTVDATQLSKITSTEEWEKLCGLHRRALCVIGFLRGDAGRDVIQSSLSNVNSALIGAAAYIDVDCQVDFASRFGVEASHAPTVIVYSPSIGQYAQFVGGFREDTVKSFLSRVFMPKTTVPFRPLDKEGELKLREECNIGAAEVIVEEEEVDDFLLEIRREEEERKKRLKEELDLELKKKAEAEKSSNKKKKKNKKSKKSSSEL